MSSKKINFTKMSSKMINFTKMSSKKIYNISTKKLFELAPVSNDCESYGIKDYAYSGIEVYTLHTIYVKLTYLFRNNLPLWLRNLFELLKQNSNIKLEDSKVWICSEFDDRNASKFEKLSNVCLIGVMEENETVAKWLLLFLKSIIDNESLEALEAYIIDILIIAEEEENEEDEQDEEEEEEEDDEEEEKKDKGENDEEKKDKDKDEDNKDKDDKDNNKDNKEDNKDKNENKDIDCIWIDTKDRYITESDGTVFIEKELSEPYFTMVENGTKTVEVIIKGDKFYFYCKEDVNKKIKVEVTDVAIYENFESLLKNEKIKNVLPDVKTIEERVKFYTDSYCKEKEGRFGVLAIHIKKVEKKI